MDFVGADDQVMRFGVSGQRQQFVPAPAAPDRVVRMAEQEETTLRACRLLQRRHVPVPAGAGAGQIDPVQPATGEMGG
ncbi:hypothetical protein SDC9_196464 [bioreactor metagenome]|uniref:Uncharacterized protein n=1 Tax=bioreactor metagenome TaxID=1076179 RepID=A0A645IDE7_9ZZZZ